MVLLGRKEWGRKEVERVIIEKTKTLLSGLWQHPLHQVPPPPTSPPSELPIQFHPHEGISSTAPSLIYPSIHLSLPQQMGKITRNSATTNSPASLPRSHIQISAPLKSVPAMGNRYVWITQRLQVAASWCQRVQNSADVGFGVGWFCVTID